MSLPVSVNLMPTAKIKKIVELAQLSEKLGYVRCWVYDEGLHTRDVFVTLTSIAIETKKARGKNFGAKPKIFNIE